MPTSHAAGAAVRPGYISREELEALLARSRDTKRTDAGLLWKFFEDTARRAQLPYEVLCRSCRRRVRLGTSCRSGSHHAVAGLHAGSVVSLYPSFMQSNFVGIGPRLRKLMGRLVRELQQ